MINLEKIYEKSKEFNSKFKDKKVFIVNHTSFYGKIFEKYLTQLSIKDNLNIEIVGGSRENDFDILNKRDVDFWFYKQADVIIHTGTDFDELDKKFSPIAESYNIVCGVGNLLEKKKPDAVFFYINQGIDSVIDNDLIINAIDLSCNFCQLFGNTIYFNTDKKNVDEEFLFLLKSLSFYLD